MEKTAYSTQLVALNKSTYSKWGGGGTVAMGNLNR
jgi:hypothetical protein